MKKFVAILLTLMLVLGIGAAVAEETYSDVSSVTVKKVYKLTNANMSSPAEIFTLEQVGAGRVTDGDATSAPALGTITGAIFAKGAATVDGTTGNITIALPTYEKVGVYEYTLREVAGKTVGVAYYGKDILLKVTVIEQGGKVRVAAVHTESGEGDDTAKRDNFPNEYSAGDLNVTKTVAGNLGDQSKKFNFTVTFTKPDGKDVNSTITATVAGVDATDFNIAWDDKGTYTYTFQLAHGQKASFANLPYGVSYTVTEAAADGYTTTKAGDSGTINAAEHTAAFTNTKEGSIDTGVTTENLPYVLLIGFVVLAGAALLIKRKAHNN